MIVVIEGVDATGKSTLATDILAQSSPDRNPRYYHSGPPSADALSEYGRAILDVQPNEDVVFDRLHWGEPVYGPLYRDVPGIDDAQFYWLELLAASRGVLTILCVDDPGRVCDRVTTLDDDFVKHDLQHLANLQTAFVNLTALSVTPVTTHVIGIDPYVKMIADLASAQRSAFEGILEITDGEYIGVPNPRVLLVGEQVARKSHPITEVPFAPYKSTSGHYLMNALLKTGLSRQVGIVNALTQDGDDRDINLVRRSLGVQQVVSLGKRAHDVLSRQEIPHGQAYHPQYVRRFNHSKIDQYAAALMIAASRAIDTTEGVWV